MEVGSWSAAMVAMSAISKHVRVELIQTELNDAPGVCVKFAGNVANVTMAVEMARAMAAQMKVPVVAEIITGPDPRAAAAYEARPDFNPLMEQATVQIPNQEILLNTQADFAVGLIETQGFTAVFEAIDTAVKTAGVEVLGREKLGGGYITVLIKGDVAAVNAAIEAGKAKVEGLGKLIAAHVIASPSAAVLALVPK
jgi:carbon dioxide concentrating mechanism protein CcmO